MKHGILSRLVVLAHEDHAEYGDLLAALIEEHRPAGMTERHLVEELAAIIWRKRRVLMAEGAKINEGLKSAVNSPRSIMPSAAPFQRGLTGENADLRDLLDATPNEIAERQRDAELDLAATRKAAAILRKGGANAYPKARRALIQESRDWWDEHVEEESYPGTAEELAQFIRETLEPIEYPVYLEWTGLHFGGRRAWFLCPAQRCGRRVAILFGDSIFACRHCHKLTYECQRERVDDRAIRRADAIRRRLGWQPGIANPAGDKPKGMHWKTYRRLQAQHDEFVTVSLNGMAKRLGLVNRRLAGLQDNLKSSD